ncbi:unnamed protein product [Durusdinium trenchii]
MGATLDSFDSNWENAQELLHGALCQNFQVDELCWEALLLAQGKGRVSPEDLETVPTAELITELRRRHDLLNRKPANVAVLGPPCAGKDTQADALRRAFGLCRISGKDLLGDSGASSDEQAVSKLAELLERPQCRRGFVLDGFPRTVAQAARLEEELSKRKKGLDTAIFLDAPKDILLERCQGRLLHEASGRLYHDSHRTPLEKGVDDFTGDPLIRPSFQESKLKEDLERHQKDSTLLRQFFSKKGCYVGEVDATKRAEEVGSACIESVRARAHTAE